MAVPFIINLLTSGLVPVGVLEEDDIIFILFEFGIDIESLGCIG